MKEIMFFLISLGCALGVYALGFFEGKQSGQLDILKDIFSRFNQKMKEEEDELLRALKEEEKNDL